MADQPERPHASPNPDPASGHELRGRTPADETQSDVAPDSGAVAPPAGSGNARPNRDLSHTDSAAREHGLLHLQAQIGNRHVQRVVQRRLAMQRQAAAPASAAPPAAAPASDRPPGLIVEDSADNLDATQMKRGQFLGQARAAANLAADQALADSPFASLVRPQVMQELDRQFARYSGLDARALESTIRAQVPGAAGAGTANAFLPLIASQVRQQVAVNVPKRESTPGVVGAVTDTLSDIAQSAGNMLSSIGSLFFKSRDGGARDAPNAGEPRAVRAQLTGGQALDSGVRRGISDSFGQDFSDVRVHTDGGAGRLADDFNARAFTVGNDIAFGPGEYQPGTPVGDALIAHELAHVAQQRGAAPFSQAMPLAGAPENALEEDADRAAVGAMTSLWGGAQGDLSRIAQNALPNLRSGLRLSRCDKATPVPQETPAPTTTSTPKPPPPPKPLFEELPTATERQAAMDKLMGKFDASLMEGGKMHYNGAVPGGEGNTYPPNDRTLQKMRRGAPLNKKPYVEIYAAAFAAQMPLLASTMFHEYQHVLQMQKKKEILVPGVDASGHAQEVEAYSREIIEAEGKGLDPKYVEDTLWRRLKNDHWAKLSSANKKKLAPLFNQAREAAQRMVGHSL